jgi:hypothetical protein
MLSSAEGLPRHDPGDALEIAKMVRTISGIKGEWNMRLALIDAHGHRKGGGWMGREAIKIETKRAEQEAGR